MLDILLKAIAGVVLFCVMCFIYGMILDMVSYAIVKSRKPSDIVLAINAVREKICIDNPIEREATKKWVYNTVSNVVIQNAHKCHKGQVYWRLSETTGSAALFKNYRLNVWVVDNKTAIITKFFPQLYAWLARERFGHELVTGYGKITICN